MSQFRLRMQAVGKSFGATAALAGVDLAVAPGSVHALIGENGAGKSTLMKILSGAHQPDAGQMWLDGRPYRPATPRDGRAAGVAMIYQELSLAPHLSVMENILLGAEPRRGPWVRWRALRQRALDALALVGRPDIPVNVALGRLSIADQQLVEVARSVAVGCRVLVLDEPTSSLSARDIDHLMQLVRRLKRDGISIIYISHFLEEVQQISDTFTVLRDGATVLTGNTAETSVATLVEAMVGRKVDQMYPRSRREPGEVLLSARGICSGTKLVDASIELRRGEVVGVAGLIGSGRTEFLRALFGLDAIERGEVRAAGWINGQPTSMWPRGMGMLSEDRKSEGLALNLSVAENMTLPQLRGLGPLGLVLPSRQRETAQSWIDRLAVRCQSARQPTHALSGGNQQKVALARLLHADVDILLLDEPTRGIDVGSKSQIYQLIDDCVTAERAGNRQPKAVLVVSSYLPELLGICDRIAVMCRGVLYPAVPVDERNEHEIMCQAIGMGAMA